MNLQQNDFKKLGDNKTIKITMFISRSWYSHYSGCMFSQYFTVQTVNCKFFSIAICDN